MSRTIHFFAMGSAFAACEAVHENGSDWGRCGRTAVIVASIDGREGYVCHHHRELLQQELGNPAEAGRPAGQ